MQRILPMLTEQEAAVYRRGRNNVHANIPKKATMAEYRAATGMECLFAYLYLTQSQARIDELFALAYPTGGQDTSKREE
jgi:ribonuclease-3 family protein